MAGEPIAVVFILALGPELPGAVGIVFIGRDEIEASPWLLHGVLHHDFGGVLWLQGLAQKHRELFVALIEAKLAASGIHDLVDLEVDGVEGDFGDVRGHGNHVSGARAFQELLFEIDGELEFDVLNVDEAVGAMMGLGLGDEESGTLRGIRGGTVMGMRKGAATALQALFEHHSE